MVIISDVTSAKFIAGSILGECEPAKPMGHRSKVGLRSNKVEPDVEACLLLRIPRPDKKYY